MNAVGTSEKGRSIEARCVFVDPASCFHCQFGEIDFGSGKSCGSFEAFNRVLAVFVSELFLPGGISFASSLPPPVPPAETLDN